MQKRQSWWRTNAVTLCTFCALISFTDEFIYVKVWAHSIVGAHATQSKHKETGPKTKTSLCSDFWGCSWDHTPLPLSKGHKVLERKAHLEEPMTQGCRISGNTWAVFFPQVSTLEMLSSCTCVCVWQGFISEVPNRDGFDSNTSLCGSASVAL